MIGRTPVQAPLRRRCVRAPTRSCSGQRTCSRRGCGITCGAFPAATAECRNVRSWTAWSARSRGPTAECGDWPPPIDSITRGQKNDMASPVNRFAPPSDMPVESATFAAMSAAFWPGSDNIGQTDWPTATTLAGSIVLPSPRHHSDELPHGLAHGCGCQHDCRLRIAEHGLETLGVSGQLRCEKRDRDVPGLDGGEEARHVFEALRRKDRDPVATGRSPAAAAHRSPVIGCPPGSTSARRLCPLSNGCSRCTGRPGHHRIRRCCGPTVSLVRCVRTG